MTANAAKSGTFKIGGDLAVHRLGFGAMRIVGKGVWGEPEDRDEAVAAFAATSVPRHGGVDRGRIGRQPSRRRSRASECARVRP